MKLSTRGRYGVRFMLDLALNDDDRPVLMKDLAGRQGLSEKYLGNLVPPLKAAGLVRSVRGARGGYLLSKRPEEISLKDIVSALEGSLCLVDCVDEPDRCSRSASCVARDVWHEASRNISRVLEEITLETMVRRCGERDQSGSSL